MPHSTLLADATEGELYAALAARGVAVVAVRLLDSMASDHGVSEDDLVRALPRIRESVMESSAPDSISTVTDNVIAIGLLEPATSTDLAP